MSTTQSKLKAESDARIAASQKKIAEVKANNAANKIRVDESIKKVKDEIETRRVARKSAAIAKEKLNEKLTK